MRDQHLAATQLAVGQYLPEPSLDALRCVLADALGRFCRTPCGHAQRFAPRDRQWEPRGDEPQGACARAKASSSAVAQTRYILAAGPVSTDLRCWVGCPECASHTALSARARTHPGASTSFTCGISHHQPTLDSEGAPGLPHPCGYSSANRLESGCRRI